MAELIGKLFPAGGPVPPELMIGRDGERADLERRLREGISTMLAGPRQRAVFFLDELQRTVTYADGQHVLQDLVDLYRPSGDVVLLVDGSEERTLDGMLGEPVHFGKLVDRLTLDPLIPRSVWRAPLTQRFAAAGLRLPDEQRERLLEWRDGAVYPTMTAARYTALNARKTGSDTITDFDVEMGLDEARRHLEDDGV